ncbi:tRNA dihydrouridine synthase DusB [Candidatus Woesearchaeota archaeon]|jgi:tRNA-dihydrouridine synthase B|nr:tRNA dihydrouridine synthase DusB [Candidatus Woesearchaeota archaeon]MBT3537765.1 tRNA dihydrouridine synthase DusB [Candidatus Woesearchaeota archaeon]MBT4697896.1 tRNA dihydrouridine synthase DusB [Candidatus Woesearchaeota archaeon]MBT4717259.1 tRNA dihydrouridine synthase DusB [Candidatus Woesearchaeota archaeon]MBT7105434.1 tRNA dihydrouridine synthase DusB [Candidatus Woesearchaeota archaeon]
MNKLFVGKVFLAPMAEVTDLAFRILCRKYGADVAVSEMVSANALSRDSQNSLKIIQTCEEDKPLGIQIFGQNTECIEKAVKIVEDKCDFIDFNLGCPAPKIIDQGAGSALLKRPNRIKEILETMVSNSKVPVTVKIRSGINKGDNVAVKIAKIAEEAGVEAIAVHARSQQQKYSGEADWNIIKEVKENVGIAVIGNGDIEDAIDAKLMREKTGCDSVMIGRASMGNPHIFKQVKELLDNENLIDPVSSHEKLEMFKEYYKLCTQYDLDSVPRAKMHLMWFTKGLKGSTKMRNAISRIKTFEEVEEWVQKIV